jgi:hypothetical protein
MRGASEIGGDVGAGPGFREMGPDSINGGCWVGVPLSAAIGCALGCDA